MIIATLKDYNYGQYQSLEKFKDCFTVGAGVEGGLAKDHTFYVIFLATFPKLNQSQALKSNKRTTSYLDLRLRPIFGKALLSKISVSYIMSAKILDAYEEQEAIEIVKHHVSIFYLKAVRKLACLMKCLYLTKYSYPGESQLLARQVDSLNIISTYESLDAFCL